MNNKKFNVEYLLYAIAFMVGLFIRMYRIGDFPLDGNEAQWALMAFQSLGDTPLFVGHQPGYVIFTSILFNVFFSSNFLAHFIPVIAGSILIFFPIFLKKYISSYSAMIVAFGLALDPSLIAISRNADGGAIALTSFIFFIGFLLNGNAIGSGINLGLAVMGGPDFWHGLLIIGTAWLLNYLVIGQRVSMRENFFVVLRIFRSMKFILSLSITVLLINTLFLTQPQALGGIFSSFTEYFDSWINPVARYSSPFQVLMTFIFYELFPLSFAIIGLFWIYYKRLHDYLFFIVCWLVAIGVGLVYPQREGIDLVWVVIPLWVLAAFTIEHVYIIAKKQAKNFYLFTALICVLLVFMVFNLLSLMNNDPGSVEFQLRLAIIAGTAIVIGLLGILLTWGWSPGLAYSSFLSGIMILLFLYNFSAAWRSAKLSSSPYAELWYSAPYFQDADLLEKSIRQVSDLNTGNAQVSDITILEPVSLAVKWILKNQEDVVYLNSLPNSISPDMVITGTADFPGLAASYTGQDFVLIEVPETHIFSPMDWLKWVIYRKFNPQKTNIYLWVKSDISPGTSSSSEINNNNYDNNNIED